MLLFPIGTDRPQRQFPWMNVLLIAANIIIYFVSHPVFHLSPAGGGAIPGVDPGTDMYARFTRYLLDPGHPALYQFISYQFLHQGPSHIIFNMLFLYVFGNNLNEKLGHTGYLAFYLTGGILAGCGQMIWSNSPTLGASGSISAVTGLFLVLLPRTHIRMFFSLFFLYMDVWEIPSMYFILFKIGQDIVERIIGGSHVAYEAHLSGTLAGIVIGLVLLFAGLVQRDHYDLLAMLNRYRRRKTYESLVASGYDPFRAGAPAAGAGVSGVLGTLTGRAKAAAPPADPRVEVLREEVSEHVRRHELPQAVAKFLELHTIDPAHVMGAQDQLDIANQLMSDTRYPEAAGAYEDYLRVYPTSQQRDQVALILGLIYARYLPRPDRARELFTQTLPRLHDTQQRAWAEGELKNLGPAAPG